MLAGLKTVAVVAKTQLYVVMRTKAIHIRFDSDSSEWVNAFVWRFPMMTYANGGSTFDGLFLPPVPIRSDLHHAQ